MITLGRQRRRGDGVARLADRRSGVGPEVMIQPPSQELAPDRLELRIAGTVAECSKRGLRGQYRELMALPLALVIAQHHHRSVAVHHDDVTLTVVDSQTLSLDHGLQTERGLVGMRY